MSDRSGNAAGGGGASRGLKVALGVVGAVVALGALGVALDVNGIRSDVLARRQMASEYGTEDGDVYLDVLRNARFQWQRSQTSFRLARRLSTACDATFGLRVYWNGPVPRQREHRIVVRIPAGSNQDVRDTAVVQIDGAAVAGQGSGGFLEWPLPQPDDLGTAEVRFELTDDTSEAVRPRLGIIRTDGCGLQILRRQKGG